ncbi:S8 family serine peptidase [Aquipuribacter nitratireducens]|uniref:S8 family serine peptidase n=1 Tax=Aquipuribacter nitratireducens TaxID=650104 RepID=A0ABW0GL94_9MICO
MISATRRVRCVVAGLAATATAVGGVALAGTPATAAPLPYDDGSYVVLLDEPAVASYDGGVPGYAATRPAEGEAVDVTGRDVRRYADRLASAQADLLDEVDAEATYTYQVALNGFAAELDGSQATKLAALPGVTAVVPNEVRSIDTVQTPEFLGLDGEGGLWEQVGGPDAAGEGVVVGVLDTGVWPENPSFAGERLRTGNGLRTDGKGRVVGRNPLVGTPFRTADGEVYMLKGDRTVFRGECELGEGWESADLCNDKLVTARYFADSFVANVPEANRGEFEYLSARDGDGHGSHTAGTAAGNDGVPMSIDGIDLGEGSGMAPGAKLAVYKVCWEDDDPNTGGCYTADSLRAIEQAVVDGVDVLNYSISGTTTTVVDAVELAFYNAANAGVFVAASAGNSGPGSSTTAHNSPWVMTVGATTFKRDEGTVVLGNGETYLGASVIQSPLAATEAVLSSEVALAGADPDEATLCYPGTLDPALVDGKVVVCDRGVIARVDKSLAVAQAGGVGTVLANVAPSSLDPDFHSVPTVHVDEVAGAEIKDYVGSVAGATVAFEVGDTTGGEPTPLPQIAGFSSRGPTLAAGSDIIKPDIAAPGVAVVAAVAPGPNNGNDFNAISGTSMSSPHVAGLGALVLGENPLWHPSTVKSAMMTTADDIKDTDGDAETDPFVQGAGFVDPAQMLRPGLVLEAGEEEWARFYAGQGLQLGEPGSEYEPLATTDLNYPSIAIGQQAGPQTVTRTFRALQAGTWDVSVDVPGYEVTTSVDTVRGDASGKRSTSVDLTFTRTDATLADWATGFVTLEGPTTVRMPVALRPVSVAAPAEVSGAVADGAVDVEITPGFEGELALETQGLARGNTVAATFAQGQQGAVRTTIPAGTSFARFDLDAVNDEADLDLTVYRMNAAGTALVALVGQSATGAADERVDVLAPVPGIYYAVLSNYANAPGESSAAFEYTTYAVTPSTTLGGFTAEPNPLDVSTGEPTSFRATWSGLTEGAKYLGWVGYEGAIAPTIVSID